MMEATISIALMCVTAILVLIGITVIYRLWVRIKREADQACGYSRKHEIKVPLKQATYYDAALKKLIYHIRTEVFASKVFIGRFHNGGNFANGLEMKKSTVTHETPFEGKVDIQDTWLARFNSRYPETFLTLVTTGDVGISNIDNGCLDQSFKKDFTEYGYRGVYLYLIRQLDGSEEAFLGVAFSEHKLLTAEQQDKVREHIPEILGLLNMIDHQ